MKDNNNKLQNEPPLLKSTSQAQVSQRLEEILQGQTVNVYKGDAPTEIPAWLDRAKFAKGRQFFRQYMSGVFFAHLVALVITLCSPQVLKPLMFTRKSDTPWRAFRRYVQTVVHVYSWYIYDVWDPESPGRQSISVVREMHSQVLDVVNHPDTKKQVQQLSVQTLAQGQKKFVNLNGETQALPAFLDDIRPNVPASHLPIHPNYFFDNSQYDSSSQCPFMCRSAPNPMADKSIPFVNQTDMSLTQFAFIGLIVMYPEKFGAGNATKEELEGFIHFWRGTGYLLGIDDRFNFCREDNYDFTRELCLLTVDRLIKPQLASANEEYEHMSRALLKGTRYYLPMYTLECILLYIAYITEMTVPNLTRVVPWSAWLYYWYLRIVFSVLCKIPFFLKLNNFLLYFSILTVVNPPPSIPKCMRPPQIHGLELYFP